jgi:hypothetical protein
MTILHNYFSNEWKPDPNKYIYSGWKLLDKIKEHETILDIGCGYNLFKPYFENRLYGIDPANDNADEVVSIENFKSNKKWDVLLCLGSINFGSFDTIDNQIKKLVTFVKDNGRIYWRQNPGVRDHPWKGVSEIEFFPWTFDLNYYFADKHDCKVLECKWDINRIYSVWSK